MKKITLLLFLIFGIKSAFSECSMNGMQFYPEQKEISLNSMFIIQGYSFSQKTINSFKTRTIFLESPDGQLIKLNLHEILKGQMSLTQAIFKPNKMLAPNTTYFLKYKDQTENETREIKQWNSTTKKREKVYWKTTINKPLELLSADLKIEFNNSEVMQYGCGPSANAIFRIKNGSSNETWFKTEVVDISSNSKTTYYLKASSGNINVGHGMCAGAFTFDRNGKYKVRFTPRKSLKTTNWKTFDSPFMNNNDNNLFGL